MNKKDAWYGIYMPEISVRSNTARAIQNGSAPYKTKVIYFGSEGSGAAIANAYGLKLTNMSEAGKVSKMFYKVSNAIDGLIGAEKIQAYEDQMNAKMATLVADMKELDSDKKRDEVVAALTAQATKDKLFLTEAVYKKVIDELFAKGEL